MIRRITIEQFMSHVHTVIEPAAGLTVIVGPNNCGKSALVAALQCLSYNALGKPFVRHGSRWARVTVETGEGDRIEWMRENDSVTYTINGVKTHRGIVPDDLPKKLRINEVKADDDTTEFDIHFAEQKKPIFLLGQDKHAALFFASSSDAGYLLKMQQNWKSRIRARRQEAKQLGEDLARDQAALAGFEPLEEVACALEEAEKHFGELDVIERRRAEVKALIAKLETASRTQQIWEAASTCLEPLAPLPDLADDESCRKVVIHWRRTAHAELMESQRLQVLDIPSPPVLEPTESLASNVAAMRTKQRFVAKVGGKAEVVAQLEEPPALTDVRELAQAIKLLAEARRRIEAKLTEVNRCSKEQSEAKQEIERFIADHPECPTCGGTIDAERFLNRGEHVHV